MGSRPRVQRDGDNLLTSLLTLFLTEFPTFLLTYWCLLSFFLTDFLLTANGLTLVAPDAHGEQQVAGGTGPRDGLVEDHVHRRDELGQLAAGVGLDRLVGARSGLGLGLGQGWGWG